jgi:hypothetical protein
MGYCDAPLSYEDMLQDFKNGLGRALSGATLPATLVMSDLSVTLPLLDIAHAVREKRPTRGLITRACAAFAKYAADQDAAQRLKVLVTPR